MTSILRIGGLALLVAATSLLTGCPAGNVVSPVTTPYRFISVGGGEYARYVPQVYAYGVAESPQRLKAVFTQPSAATICFLDSLWHQVGAVEPAYLEFGPGVYPFVLKEGAVGDVALSGAMMVVNVNESVGLATFGKVKETQLFSSDLLAEARKGVLGKGVITFDEKPVILYWLGDRKKPSRPGEPTVELDFSGVAGLREIWIDGTWVDGRVAVVDAYRLIQKPTFTRVPVVGFFGETTYQTVTTYTPEFSPVSHKLELVMSTGTKYVGYIRNLEADAFTTFVRVPCRIPPELFSAADRGTIAKYTVTAGEKGKERPVAEIVFGQGTP